MFKIIKDGKLPTRGTKFSACVDLYSAEDVVISTRKTEVVGLGVAIDTSLLHYTIDQYCLSNREDVIKDREKFLSSHYMQLMLRSSLGKKGLILPNGVGIIDMDYKDEIKMIIYNATNVAFTIKKGDKIGQITLLEHKSHLFNIDSDTERVGGIGSTGL